MSSNSSKQNKSTALIVDNVTVSYGDHVVVDEVSFSLDPGTVTVLIGPNGSGKTTLMKAMLGLLPMTSGDVRFGDTPLSGIRSEIGYVPQRFDIDRSFPMTLEEFLLLPAVNRAHKDRLLHTLDDVGLPHELRTALLGTLSGGQLQRAFVAQAIMSHPKYLFLDEPSSAIDVQGEKALYDIFDHLVTDHDTTILIVSHDIGVVSEYADQVICLNRTLLCAGTPSSTLTKKRMKALYGEDAAAVMHCKH